MRRFAVIVLTGLLFLFLHATVAAEGPSSCSFAGSVRLDNVEVADGTLITALIDGDEYYAHTSTGYGYSTYFVTIRASDGKNYPDGTKVSFKVNGHTAVETAIFKAGENIRVDLSASTASSLPSNIAIISGLVFAFLLACAAAYYFLFRRRGRRFTDLLRGKAGVPSEQAAPSSVENQGQPVYRYIWDNDKLAWVENKQQVKSKPSKKKP